MSYRIERHCSLRWLLEGLLLLVFITFLTKNVSAHEEPSKADLQIGIDEKLGQIIPLDLTFNDEQAHPVSLKQLIHSPTIFAPVYYGCSNVCSFLLFNLAGTVNKLPAEPNKDYQVIAISFDENEKPGLALEKKKMYLNMIEKPFPEDAWKFLTGDKGNIHKLMDAIGFHFKRLGKDFEHPVTLVILSQEGKITRYIYGTDFLPFDLKMAILEASEERVGPTVSKVLRFCFSFDPKGRKYVFNTLKVTGIVTLFFALSLILFLVFKGKKKTNINGINKMTSPPP